MKPALACLVLLLATVAAAAEKPAAKTVTLTGMVQDCWDGKAVPVSGVEVYAYDAAKHPQLQRLLQRLARLAQDLDMVGGEERFYHEFDRLDRLVRSTRARTPHARTRGDGGYRLRGLPAGRRYLLLAIDLEAQDDTYYDFVATEALKPGAHQFDLWLWPEARQECRPLLHARARPGAKTSPLYWRTRAWHTRRPRTLIVSGPCSTTL